MYRIKVIYFLKSGRVTCDGVCRRVDADTLVVANPLVQVASDYSDGFLTLGYTLGDLHVLHREIAEVLRSPGQELPVMESIRVLPTSRELGQIIRHFEHCDRRVLLKFIWLYCLGMDERYFTQLLVQLIDGNVDFFEFLDQHSLKAWPVSNYAAKLGISLRKLNQLFKDKFGMSTKRWLLEHRLLKARELLTRTSMTVTDIAMHCGFNSHAHFSETFKKRYQRCPRELRQCN